MNVVNECEIENTKIGQSTIIRYKCCCCGNIFEKQYKNYKHNKLCRKCSMKLKRKVKDEPIVVVTKEDVEATKKYGILQKIQFCCDECGRTCIVENRSFNGVMKCSRCKRKETLDKLGDDYKEKIIQKGKATRLERYGDSNYTNAEQRKKTMLKKYGVENYLELKDKIEECNLKKYGVPHYVNPKKIKKTMYERYGGYTWESKELRKKCDLTLRQKYGKNLEKIIEKVKSTKLERYEDENYNNKEKHRETCLQNYGVTSYSKTNDFIHKSLKKYRYDGENFDSTWELCFWIYATENGHNIIKEPKSFPYTYNGETHYYFPDYCYDGELVEIKGKHFLKNGTLVNPYDKEQDGLYSAKYKCMIDNGVKILTDVSFAIEYVRDKYTKDYVKLFSTTKSFPIIHINKDSIINKKELDNIWKNKFLIKELAIKSIQRNGRCKPIDIISEINIKAFNEDKYNKINNE